MKVLVLSCSTGEGYNSAAKAVCEAFDGRGAEYEMIDPLSFKGGGSEKKAAGWYNNLIRKRPRLFGFVYRAGKIVEGLRLPSPVYAANRAYADKLADYIDEGKFDAVVSTHVYGMEALTAIKNMGRKNIPYFGVLTDYTLLPFIRETDLDEYFTSHKDLTPYFVRKKMDESKLVPCGIPISARYRERIDKAEARRELGLDENKEIILIMQGGAGNCGVLKTLKKLLKRSFDNRLWCVLVGKNTEMKEKIERKFPSDRVKAIGFTDKVGLYFAAADVVVSKGGGLSTTEIAVSNVPFVCFKPIPGCETANARFFEKKGMTRRASSVSEVLRATDELSKNAATARKMKEAQRACINPYAADEIARRVTEWTRER